MEASEESMKKVFLLLLVASAPILIGMIVSVVEYFRPYRCDAGRHG